MKKFSKTILSLIIIILIIWLVPWIYDFFTYKPQKSPFTLYSSVIDDFTYSYYESGDGLIRVDSKGNQYTEKEFDQILPFFYVRQLLNDQRFPDSIAGILVSPREVQMQNFVFRNVPSKLQAPQIKLYYLLESMSGRVELQLPNDVFRITQSGIEFIDANTNEIDETKSLLFTKVMSDKGFVFPAKQVVGDPNTRKDYDEGYLIEDKDGKLYQLKMVKGRPFVRSIVLPDDLNIKYLFVTEFRGRKTLGFISDTNNKLYALMAGSYEVKQVDIPSFDPQKEVITIFGNLLDWTIQITSSEKETYYAINAEDLSLIRSFAHKPELMPFFERWRSIFMPVRLHFTSQYDKWVTPRINKD